MLDERSYEELSAPAVSEVLISRRPVCDERRRVVTYRISYAALDGGVLASAESTASARLLGTVVGEVGLEEIVGGTIAELPMSAGFLRSFGTPPVRPERAMLSVPYHVAVQAELAEPIEALRARGFTLILSGAPPDGFSTGLLDSFRWVDVDLETWTMLEAESAIPALHAGRRLVIASGVSDHAQLARLRELGCARFEGPFYSTPEIVRSREVAVARLATVAAIARAGNADLEELEEVISRDVGLSVKLLRYLNSAFIGLRGNVSSIRQAVTYLGTRGVARWALLVSLAGAPTSPRELAEIALTRARLCEQLGMDGAQARPEELFTAGLLSAADALLGVPLEAALGDLPLTPAMRDGLLFRTGPIGHALDAAIAYERGRFSDPALDVHRRALGANYLGALSWASETVGAIR
jgi:c-di-GMP phosphodiesterase